jgi:hypothetical protein
MYGFGEGWLWLDDMVGHRQQQLRQQWQHVWPGLVDGLVEKDLRGLRIVRT